MADQLRAAAQRLLNAVEDGGHKSDVMAAADSLRAALAFAEHLDQPAWWRDGLTATLMREGINKHRAREIADGYWQAYCEIGGNDD